MTHQPPRSVWSDPRHWELRAQIARDAAEGAYDETSKTLLLQVAERYDALAKYVAHTVRVDEIIVDNKEFLHQQRVWTKWVRQRISIFGNSR